jgi:glycosylphosphatidylinositol transamidase (GPIT) subunit GPI8
MMMMMMMEEEEEEEEEEEARGGNVTILWNQQVQTDRTIPNNKPDNIIRDNEKRAFMLIHVAISGNRNMIKKEAEKFLKYKDLTIEIQRMWNVRKNRGDSSNNRRDWDNFRVI